MAPAPGDIGGSPKKAPSASAADAAAAAAAAIAAARVGAGDQLQKRAEQRVIPRRGCRARGGGQGKMRNMTAERPEYSETETSEDSSSPSPSDGVCRSVADVLDSNVSEETGRSFFISFSTLCSWLCGFCAEAWKIQKTKRVGIEDRLLRGRIECYSYTTCKFSCYRIDVV